LAGEAGANDDPNAEGGAAGDAASGGADIGGGGASAGSSSGGAAANAPPSCKAGGATSQCGPNEESCCTSLPIPGQTFFLGFDGVSADYKDKSHSASVTGFRLDKYEVTVGRFRQFVAAVVGSWRPDAGAGKHAHLLDGAGLKNVGATGGNEAGWDAAWSSQLASKAALWNANLACDQASASWTPSAGSKELYPISCVNWYEAYAFCIWDDAFLPSEAEWNDAASAGSQQRAYPWSSPPSSLDIDCAHANYRGKEVANELDFCTAPGTGSVAVVGGASPLGDGRWGHSDLAGNVYEWTLDSFASALPSTCPDCVNAEALPNKVIRGGGFGNDAEAQLVSARNANAPAARSTSMGIRCARIPAP
jgi:formylglycine-generating enzyme required for sulfatase activity